MPTKKKPKSVKRSKTTSVKKTSKRSSLAVGGKTITSSGPSLLSLFPDFRKKQYLARVKESQDQLVRELKEAYLHRGLVLYLGAGVSRSIGLPNWPEVIRSLTVTMMTRKVRSAMDALEGLTDAKRVDALVSIQQEVIQEADYDKPILMMARAIKDEFIGELPQLLAFNLYRRLRGRLRSRPLFKSLPKSLPTRRTNELPIPESPLINSIVALARAERDVSGVQAIVNYNFDDLVDERLRQQNVRCKTVLSGRDRVPSGTLPCYHVHGVLPVSDYAERLRGTSHKRIESKGNFVFSEDEYHAEYSDAYKWSNMTQMSLLGRYTGLFVGLSMEDPNIRRLIDVTHRQYPEISNYAILTRRRSLSNSKDNKQSVLRNLFEGVETSSFGKIGVKIIWVDEYQDIPKVLNQICEVEGS